VNVVDLMVLQSPQHHPHGIADDEFDRIFTTNRPVIFAYHGYPYLIHRLVYKRTNHPNFHVHGFIEQGTTTTPFDMTVLNDVDPTYQCSPANKQLQLSEEFGAAMPMRLVKTLVLQKGHVRERGESMPDSRNCNWGARF